MASIAISLKRIADAMEEFKKFTTVLAKNNSIKGNSITSITKDFEGNILLGTDGGGLNKFDMSTALA